MGYNYDRTKRNIGADDLDSRARKDMLNKFQGAGGEVIREYDENHPAPGQESPRQRAARGAGGGGAPRHREVKMPSELAREKARQEQERIARQKAEAKARVDRLGNFWSRIQIQFKAAFAGVSSLGSRRVKARTMQAIVNRGRRALMEFNILGSDLFHSDPATGAKITSRLDEIDPLYMELMERAQKMFRSELFEQLSGTIADANSEASLDDLREPVAELYCELYYFYPFYNTYLKAAEAAIKYQGELGRASASMQADKWKRIRREVNFAFLELFPKLYMILLKADMKLYPPGSVFLEQAIGYDREKRIIPPKRKPKREEEPGAGEEEAEESSANQGGIDDPEEEKTGETEEAPAKKKEPKVEEMSKEVKYGLGLMRVHNLLDLRKKHDPKGHYESLPINDKVLLTFLYLQEFDFEYAFVLTTNKIQMQADYSGGAKKDYRQMGLDLYDRLKAVEGKLKFYVESNREIEKLRKNPVGNYIQNTKNIGKEESNKSSAGRDFRMLTKEVMTDITENLKMLIKDMKASQSIIQNMSDPITFDARVEGKKRLNGKKISQCIVEAYCFARALVERLDRGDLFGGVLEMTEEEFLESFGREEYNRIKAAGQSAGAPAAGAAAPAEKPGQDTVDPEIDLDSEINEEETAI